MPTLNALLFPDTILSPQRHFPLLLLCDSLHLLQPVEGEPVCLPFDQGSDTFMEKGFCQGHTPSPLAGDRDRFLHLIHDIATRKDSYAAQLSSLTLAALSEQAGPEDSRQAILSSLVSSAVKNKESEEEREELWQARLVLKMGEILDQEETELIHHLAAIDSEERELFQRLQGELTEDELESDDPFAELLALHQQMTQPRPTLMANRVKAWSALFHSGPLPEPFWLWTCDRRDGVDLLFDRYEEKSGQPPLPLLRFALPAAQDSDEERVLAQVDELHARLAPLRNEIATALHALAISQEIGPTEPSRLLPQAEAWQAQFQETMATSFPEETSPAARHLTIYLFPGTPLSALLPGKRTGQTNLLRHGLLAVAA